jgi:hypothetical protein
MKKRRGGNSERRCWRSARFLRLNAGCHHFSVMHAHSGGEHGITLRVQACWLIFLIFSVQRHAQVPYFAACLDLAVPVCP